MGNFLQNVFMQASHTISDTPFGKGRSLYFEKYSNLLSLPFQLSISDLGISIYLQVDLCHQSQRSTWKSTWNSNIDLPLLDSSMNRKAPIPVFGLSASSLLPCNRGKEKTNRFSVRIIASSSTVQGKYNTSPQPNLKFPRGTWVGQSVE